MPNDKNTKTETEKGSGYSNKIDLKGGLNEISFNNKQALNIINSGDPDKKYGQNKRRQANTNMQSYGLQGLGTHKPKMLYNK